MYPNNKLSNEMEELQKGVEVWLSQKPTNARDDTRCLLKGDGD